MFVLTGTTIRTPSSLLSYSPATGFLVIRLQPLTTLVVLSTLSSRVAMYLIRRTTAKLMLL